MGFVIWSLISYVYGPFPLEISCGDPGIPTHGKQTNVVKNFAFRGTVEFQCDKDYTLHGKSSLSCQRNKTWDGDVPKCLGKYLSCD